MNLFSFNDHYIIFCRIMENLRNVSEESDRDIMKLTRELRDANSILSSLHDNIQTLNAERERSQSALEGVKRDYKALLEEKIACQKQISTLKRYLNDGKIHDRRIVREIDQLCMCYEKLDQREKLMRRQISILEAELALVISKLKVPKGAKTCSSSGKIPRLNLNKSRGRQGQLPPVNKLPKVSLTSKICPKVPKEILNITHRSDDAITRLSSRSESRRRERESREFPPIDIRAHHASKQVNEIEQECKRLYEKGNEILRREASSRRKQRIEDLKASNEKFGPQKQNRQGTSGGDGKCKTDRGIFPEIYPRKPRNESTSKPDMIWNDLSVVNPPARKTELHRHRKRAVLPELGQSKMNLSNRC